MDAEPHVKDKVEEVLERYARTYSSAIARTNQQIAQLLEY